MTTAGRWRGRRNNGLDATDWRAIDDLDPRVSEDVLEVLATRGIAAYVQPSMDVDPITRSATVPSRPTDRLYVDRHQAVAARDLLRRLFGTGPSPGPGPDPAPDPADADADADAGPDPTEPTEPAGPAPASRPGSGSGSGSRSGARPGASGAADAGADLDATFAGIVAGFDRPVDATAAFWPDAENIPSQSRTGPAASGFANSGVADPGVVEPGRTDPDPEPADTDADPDPAEPPRRPAGLVDARSLTEPSLLDALDTFGADLPDEPTDRFVPPPPPPLPRLSRQSVLGGLAILAGLLMLLDVPDLPLDRSTTMLLGFAAILSGAIALILRLRPGTDPEESRPDDGAQV